MSDFCCYIQELSLRIHVCDILCFLSSAKLCLSIMMQWYLNKYYDDYYLSIS